VSGRGRIQRTAIDSVRSHVSDLRGLLNLGTPAQRREVLASFVEEVTAQVNQATIRYSVPIRESPHPDEARKVLGLVSIGGAGGTRTLDPLNAIEVLSQLSYSPGTAENRITQRGRAGSSRETLSGHGHPATTRRVRR
jgi:hypothetical protein